MRDQPAELTEVRTRVTANEVRRTAAVGRAEARNRDACSRQAQQPFGPRVLKRVRVGQQPAFAHNGVPAQVINVPVRFGSGTQMVAEPAGQASGTKSTADVNVPAAAKREGPQSTDGD